MKIGAKEKNLLIGLVGVLVAVLTWYLVASPMKEKTEALKYENDSLKVTKDEYEAVNAQKGTYEQGIVDLTAEREVLLSKFPAGISREDQIMYWAKMENEDSTQLILDGLVMSNWEEIYVEGAPAADGGEGATQLHLYKAPVNYSFASTYDGLKHMVRYVFAQNDKKSIQALSVMVDSSTGNLTGTMDMNMYYMAGTGKEYVPTPLPTVPTGVSDVFQTVGGDVNTGNGSEFAVDEETEE